MTSVVFNAVRLTIRPCHSSDVVLDGRNIPHERGTGWFIVASWTQSYAKTLKRLAHSLFSRKTYVVRLNSGSAKAVIAPKEATMLRAFFPGRAIVAHLSFSIKPACDPKHIDQFGTEYDNVLSMVRGASTIGLRPVYVRINERSRT